MRGQIESEAYGYVTRRGGVMDGRYVIAKLGRMRKAREWLVQATDDDRIIVQGNYNADGTHAAKGAIGCFKVDGSGGRLCLDGGYFPHLSFGAKPFEFPPDFVKACLEVGHALDAVTEGPGITVEQTVRVIG